MIQSRLLKLLSSSKKYIIMTVFFQWMMLICQIIFISFISKILSDIYLNTVDSKKLFYYIFFIFISIILRFIFEKLSVNSSFKASVDVKKTLRIKIYEKILNLGNSYTQFVATSEVTQICTEGVEQLEIYFGKYLPQFFYSLLAPLTLFIYLSTINFKSSIVLLICVPLIPASIIAVQKIAKKLLSKYWGSYTALGDSFLENLQGLTTLKIYKRDKIRAEKMDADAQHFRKITMKVLVMQLNSISIMDLITYGGSAIGIIICLFEFKNGNISLYGTLCIILLASEFFIPIRILGSFFHIAMNGMAASDKIFKLLNLNKKSQGEEKFPKKYNIKLSNINFSYDSTNNVINDLSITLNEGNFCAIVGESGCGKSTLTKLILGKVDNYSGNIYIDGVSVKSIDPIEIMKNIVLVKHNSYIFKGSVRDNLLMANKNSSDDDLNLILKKVNLYDFFNNLKGLDTNLTQQGNNLSGGQRQRLAIARAFLADAPIYIFDEATSNIDAESEQIILNIIKEMSKTKTILVITHKLSNIIDADMIYFMKNGRVYESGTHNELIKNNDEYSKLYKLQYELESIGGNINE